MLIELIEKYIKRKKKVEENAVLPVVEEKQEFDITISKINNIFMVDVSDYISIVDYVERMKKIDSFNLLDLICNAVLWNGSKQKVNKGSYFVVVHNDALYNIFLGEDEVSIDERVRAGEETHEKNLTLKNDGIYHYASFKHDKTGSTFYTMYYSKDGFPIKAFELSKEDAHEEISEFLERTELIPGVQDILNINDFRLNVLDDIVLKSDGVSKK